MKYIHFPFVLLTILLACNLFTACNDDEGGGVPVIHHIRLVDPEKADSTFTDVNPGTMIVVIGENLNDVRKVFINEQEVSFNSNYGTSTSLILTIPGELQLTGANPELKGELRIETSHGIATYSMHVLSPAPYITRVATTFPVETGTPLRIVGGNFYEIQRVYFTTAVDDITNAPVSVEVTDYTVNKNFDEISFNAPAGLIDEGSLVVECYTASAFTPFRRTALPPSISKVSSMMPITGTTVTVLGQNFMDIASITMGNRSVDLSTVTVSEANDMLTFTMPRAPQGTCSLAITTMGGTAEVPGFYPLENIVLNYDNIGWFSWAGKLYPSLPTVQQLLSSRMVNATAYQGNFQHGITGGANCRTVPYGALTQPSCLPIHRLPNWLCSSNASWQWNMAKVLYSASTSKGMRLTTTRTIVR